MIPYDFYIVHFPRLCFMLTLDNYETTSGLQPVTSSSTSTSSLSSSAPHTMTLAQPTQAAIASTPSSGQQQQEEGQSTPVVFLRAFAWIASFT